MQSINQCYRIELLARRAHWAADYQSTPFFACHQNGRGFGTNETKWQHKFAITLTYSMGMMLHLVELNARLREAAKVLPVLLLLLASGRRKGLSASWPLSVQ